MISDIVNIRIKNGFAIIKNPVVLKPTEIKENWEEQLPVYNNTILECFSKQPKFLSPWLDAGISYDAMMKFGVRFDMVRNRIVFPVLDRRGYLVGIKVRNFNPDEILYGRKYMPLWHGNELYNYPSMYVLFGFYQNSAAIKKAKEAVVIEAEKGVIAADDFYTSSKIVAVGGSAFSQYHGIILKNAGVKKVVLAFDNDWDENGDKLYGLKKMIKQGKNIRDMGFEVDIIYDWNEEYLGNKDAPVDKGRSVYSKLYRARKSLEQVIEEYGEEETDELSDSNEKL